MRAAAVAVIAVVAAPIIIIAQPEEACRPNQHLLMVHVAETRLVDPETYEVARTLRDGFWSGTRFVDLCDVAGFRGTNESNGIIELKRGLGSAPFQLLVLTETPKQLCSALPGCLDASSFPR